MSRLTLRRGDRHAIIAEDAGDGLCLTGITNGRRGGVGIDVTYIARLDAGTLEAQFKRTGWSVDIGVRDMLAIAGEAPTKDLGNDGSPATHGMVITLDDQCGSTTAGYQSIALTIEGTAGSRGLVLAL